MTKNITTMDAALDWIYSFVNYETRRTAAYDPEHYSLARMNYLLDALGYTQTFRVLHIAGTKGKGSTAHAAARSLHALGHRTGLFTSPHIMDVRERIQVNGELIGRRAFIALVRKLRGVSAPFPERMTPTTFELFTALAFMYFNERRVDWAVVEVGMGGRLDSTNVVHADAVIITSLSFDHMEKLGRTLPAIAAEKAGIIKSSAPVFTASQPADALAVIRRAAEKHGAPLCVFGDDIRSSPVSVSAAGTAFSYPSHSGVVPVRTMLIGAYQAENISLAMRAVETAADADLRQVSRMARAVRGLTIRGRMDIISRHPLTIVDGAHNKDSMEKLVTAVRAIAPGKRFAVLFAPLLDKDIDGMLDALSGFPDELIISAPLSHKSADAHGTAEKAKAHGMKCREISGFSDALKAVNILKKQGRCILVTGSLYAVSSFYTVK